jgi:lysozyme
LRNLLVLMMLCVAQPVLGRAIMDPVKLEASVRASAIEKAKTLIRGFEDLRLKAYICPGGQLTIGYGHTGPDVYEGQIITIERAEELLESDMIRFVDGVDQLIRVPLTDGQAAACASLMFNIGVGSFERSTLLRLLNGLDYEGAAKQFLRWNKSKGEVLDGLTTRRETEKLIFEGKA